MPSPFRLVGKGKGKLTLRVQYFETPVLDQPPFSRSWFPTVLAAWSLAPILLWTNGFTIPETSANVPQNREWVETVRQSWEPQTEVRQARRFVPQGEVAVEAQTPYKRVWLSTVTAAWQEESQPRQARYGQIVSVDAPPPISRLQEEIKAAWQPDTWDAQTGPKFRPPTPDDPPFSARRQAQGWESDTWSAQSARHTPLEAAAVIADQPFRRPWLSDLIASWTQELPNLQARRFVVQQAAAAVDAPPIGYRPWLKTALQSWAPAPVLIWQNGVHVADGPAPDAHDNPPFGRRLWLQTALSSWEQTLVPLWGSVGIQSVDNPPFGLRAWLPITLRAWESEWLMPRQLLRSVHAVVATVDNPPTSERTWFALVVQAWEPAPYPPYYTTHHGTVTGDAGAPAEVSEWIIRARRRGRR